MMKAVLVLVVLALAAVAEAGLVPAATKVRQTKDLSEVVQQAQREGKAGLRVAAEVPAPAPATALDQPAGAGARGLAACYEPGCDYQCRSYGYAGGFCKWGGCKCWYW